MQTESKYWVKSWSLKVCFCWRHFLPGVTILPAPPSPLLWTSQMLTNRFPLDFDLFVRSAFWQSQSDSCHSPYQMIPGQPGSSFQVQHMHSCFLSSQDLSQPTGRITPSEASNRSPLPTQANDEISTLLLLHFGAPQSELAIFLIVIANCWAKVKFSTSSCRICQIFSSFVGFFVLIPCFEYAWIQSHFPWGTFQNSQTKCCGGICNL